MPARAWCDTRGRTGQDPETTLSPGPIGNTPVDGLYGNLLGGLHLENTWARQRFRPIGAAN
jgi:hypothetical protein